MTDACRRRYKDKPAEYFLPADSVIQQIEGHRGRGVRALLVTLSGCGGNVQHAFALYEALRRFSARGGTVIVHAVGWNASTNAVLVHAGDCVVVDPGVQIVVHSCYGPVAALVENDNRRMVEVFAERTLTPRALLEQWVTLKDNDKGEADASLLTAEDAVHHGWADFIADRQASSRWQRRSRADFPSAPSCSRRPRDVGCVFSEARDHDHEPCCGEPCRSEVERSGPGPAATLASRAAPVRREPGERTATVQAIPSLIDNVSVGVKPANIVGSHLSTGVQNFQNLWPNPTSEIEPPAGLPLLGDGSNPEFDFRFNAGAGARAGSYVRKLARSTAGTTRIATPAIGASEGETYALGCFSKAIATGGGAPGPTMNLRFLDAALATVSVFQRSLGGVSWTQAVDLIQPAPAGTVYVTFEIELTTSSAGSAEIWVDSILARRAAGTNDIADGAVTVAKIVQDSWFAPGLTNSWLNNGGGYDTAGFMKDGLGFVHLKGAIKSGVGSAFTLPAGYRPSNTKAFPLYTNDVAFNVLMDQVAIDTSGHVTPVVIGSGSNYFVSLEGIVFGPV
jgi:ATP-dependent protease ClpP protease subunit